MGYRVGHLPFDEWCRKLESCSADENVLRVLSCLFTGSRLQGESLVERFGARQAKMDTSNTQKMLAGSNISCPPVNDLLMERYLANFAQGGWIPAPLHPNILQKLLGMLPGRK